MEWTQWMKTVPDYVIDKNDTYLALSIPTNDSIRMSAIANMLLQNSKHCLLVGPTGTGKSMSIIKLLKSEYDNENWSYY
jgi:dynein heavy chain